MLSWILAQLRRRTQAWALVSTALALLGRLGALAATVAYAEGKSELAAAFGIVTAALFVLRRVVSTTSRVEAESDLYRATAKSILERDVIEEPHAEAHIAIEHGIYHATELVTSSGPLFLADCIASLFAPFALARAMSTRVLALAALGMVVVAVGVVLVRRHMARLHARTLEAQIALYEKLGTVIDGRLEIVAAGAEGSALAAVDASATHYVARAKRSAMSSALLGRLPLAAAVVVVGLLVLVLGNTPVGPLAVLVAALSVLLGATFGAHEMVRAVERLRPFGSFVLRPVRAELSRPASDARPTSVRMNDLTFRYKDTPVLEHLSREWTSGVLVLRGPNGSGKSTLLRLLVGLRDPEAGTIFLGESDLKAIDRSLVRKKIAFLPQRAYLGEPSVTVEQALALFDETPRDTKAGALERIGLHARDLDRTVGELSVGQRQRVALARVLLRDADLLLLDEPDANLDAAGVKVLAAILEELGRTKLVAVAAHGPISEQLHGIVWNLELCKEP